MQISKRDSMKFLDVSPDGVYQIETRNKIIWLTFKVVTSKQILTFICMMSVQQQVIYNYPISLPVRHNLSLGTFAWVISPSGQWSRRMSPEELVGQETGIRQTYYLLKLNRKLDITSCDLIVKCNFRYSIWCYDRMVGEGPSPRQRGPLGICTLAFSFYRSPHGV